MPSSGPAARARSRTRWRRPARRSKNWARSRKTEGIARLVIAEEVAERGEELQEAGAALAFEGYQEMVVGEEVRGAAVAVGAEGVAEMVEGAAQLGSADAHEEEAQDLGTAG